MANVAFVTSKLLNQVGIIHGWFTREGGVSEGAFDSLNIKYGMADPDDNVRENRRRALAVLGTSLERLAFIRHEHGTTLLEAKPSRADQTADATVTTDPKVVLGQGTADCPTLVVALPGRAVALIHAGWRGLHAGVIDQTIEQLTQQLDVSPGELVVGIGPLACGQHYEFGPEAIELFGKAYVTERVGRHWLDMSKLVHDQLESAGVTHIDELGICTIEDQRFFSYRRDRDENGECGRFLTAVALPK